MNVNPTLVLAALAALVFIGLALEELFRRTGIPDVLVLLLIGIAAGATGVVDVNALGGLAGIFTTAALVLILFEGAIHFRLAELRSAMGGVARMTLLGFGVAMIVVGAVSFLVIFPGDVLASLLLGATLGGTSSAVVIPIVQGTKLAADTRTALTLESAFTDVLCIVVALALAGALAAGQVDVGAIGSQLGVGFVGALLVGFALGLLWAFGLRALRQRRVSFLAIGAAVFLVYAIAEAMNTFGAIACLAFGVTLGNAPAFARGKKQELELAAGERLFLSEVAFLLKVFFFVYLGASLRLSSWEPWLYGMIAAGAIFVSRPLAVRFGLGRRTTPRRDAMVASALVPRGLAAAVLASVPAQMGLEQGPMIEAATVGAVLFSIVVSSGLVFAIDVPVVRGLYERFFRAFPESVDEVPAAAGAAGAAVAVVATGAVPLAAGDVETRVGLPEAGAAPSPAAEDRAAPTTAADGDAPAAGETGGEASGAAELDGVRRESA